ncbi:MAG: hypothetical protein EBR82_37925, partial [Caulobacteraceae bacterium]|nr:hypothetical protein [Caulobacteraceae bacterium]
SAGRADATSGGGYGVGVYGAGTYGTPRVDNVSVQDASMWTLDVFGPYLVGAMSDDGKLYKWSLDISTPTKAAVISGAPTGNSACVVTPEFFLMALGAGGDPRKVQWSDQAAETTWTPSSTNQAGSYTIQSPGRLMCGKKTRGQTLIFTDTDVHVARYIGLPFVYSIERVGESCGIISRGAVVASDTRAIWMSQAGFFAWDGGAVIPLDCDIYDAIFGGLNFTQRSKITAMLNSQFSEAWFMFPSAASTENDKVAVYNYDENTWALHTLTRLCGVDRGVFNAPIMFNASGYAYDHETGYTWDSTPYAKSGPFELGAGDRITRVRRLIFDEATSGDVRVSLKAMNWPNGTETTYGPYASGNPVSVRMSARQVSQYVEFLRGNSQWGAPRVDIVQGSKR